MFDSVSMIDSLRRSTEKKLEKFNHAVILLLAVKLFIMVEDNVNML